MRIIFILCFVCFYFCVFAQIHYPTITITAYKDYGWHCKEHIDCIKVNCVEHKVTYAIKEGKDSIYCVGFFVNDYTIHYQYGKEEKIDNITAYYPYEASFHVSLLDSVNLYLCNSIDTPLTYGITIASESSLKMSAALTTANNKTTFLRKANPYETDGVWEYTSESCKVSSFKKANDIRINNILGQLCPIEFMNYKSWFSQP